MGILGLQLSDVGGVKAVESAIAGGVVAVAGKDISQLGDVCVGGVNGVVVDFGSGGLVERFTKASGVREGSGVDGHAKVDLAGSDTLVQVVGDGIIGVVLGAVGVGLGSIHIGQITADFGPRTGVVISHQVPEVKVFVHSSNVHDRVGGGTSWCGDTQQELLAACPLARVLGQRISDFFEKAGEGLGVCLISGVLIAHQLAFFLSFFFLSKGTVYLPVNVNTIKTQVLNQLNSTLSKSLSTLGGQGEVFKVGGVGGSANRQKRLEVAVLLLHEIQLLNVTGNGTGISGVVSRVWELQIGPHIREAD